MPILDVFDAMYDALDAHIHSITKQVQDEQRVCMEELEDMLCSIRSEAHNLGKEQAAVDDLKYNLQLLLRKYKFPEIGNGVDITDDQ